jgi:hypothetical protein
MKILEQLRAAHPFVLNITGFSQALQTLHGNLQSSPIPKMFRYVFTDYDQIINANSASSALERCLTGALLQLEPHRIMRCSHSLRSAGPHSYYTTLFCPLSFRSSSKLEFDLSK